MDLEEKKKKKRNRLFITLGIVGGVLLTVLYFGFIIFAISIDGDTKIKYKEDGSITLGKNKATISNNITTNKTDKCYEITGYLTNNKKDLNSVNLEFALYNSNNYIINTTRADLNVELEKNQTWKFRANYCMDDVNEIENFKLVRASLW